MTGEWQRKLRSQTKTPQYCGVFVLSKCYYIPMEQPHFENTEKPKILYHASVNSNIDEFEPRKESFRDPNEGPAVFATPDKAIAAVFLIKETDDSWINIGYFNDVPVVVMRKDRDVFIKEDTGGTIYTLPSDSFDFDPNKGMGKHEWTSKDSVKPLDKETYPTALDTMIDNGVVVYFVDQETFNRIDQSDYHGIDIFAGLKSENELRGHDASKIKELANLWINKKEA
jgi:hypothetical protein